MAQSPEDAPNSEDPIDLASIVEPDSSSNTADLKTQQEEEDLQAEEYRAYIAGVIQDTQERKRYAGRIFWLLAYWLGGVLFLLVLSGFGNAWNWFQLSDNVLLAVVGGTTINVIGIFLVVARYLFPQRPMARPPVGGNST